MLQKPIKRYLYMFLFLLSGTACESFLDEKPDRQQAVPTTIPDFQALLDRYPIISDNDPGAGEVSADNYYLTDADWAGLTDEYRRMYAWEKDGLFDEGSNNDWFYTYRPAYTANTVLEGISNVARHPGNQAVWDNVKGQALFIRARSFLQVAMLWAPAYQENTASGTPGIPLRLSTDFNARSTRSSLQETFDRITADLQEACRLLPPAQIHPIRPSRTAAYALLARTYLYMQRYPLAEDYADSTLRLQNTLLDFNTLKASATYPIPPDNGEIIFRSKFRLPAPINISRAKILPDLYNAYAANDLRKTIFFRNNGNGSFAFKGSFEGSSSLFSGITTAELYLTRAETRARRGDAAKALEDLNTLLAARWKSGTFTPLTSSSATEVLNLVLQERRKELLMRGLRWPDLKRLNASGAGITLTRTVQGQQRTLPPNDLRYVLPIPEDVILMTGMTQNVR